MRKNINETDRWFSLPKALLRELRSTLGINGIAVYTLLAAYADQDYYSALSYRKISQKLGCSNAEAVRSLHQLEDLHLIKSEPDNSKTMFYRLLWIPPWGKHGEKQTKKSEPYRIVLTINNKYDDEDDGIKSITIHQLMNQHQTKETQLAYELAEALNDKEAIQMYISYTHRFNEMLLREVLVKVLAIPENKIRKTRGALFNYLIQQHAAKGQYYPRD